MVLYRKMTKSQNCPIFDPGQKRCTVVKNKNPDVVERGSKEKNYR
jgi:hypothetical protein